jgi:hypothetical protein
LDNRVRHLPAIWQDEYAQDGDGEKPDRARRDVRRGRRSTLGNMGKKGTVTSQ